MNSSYSLGLLLVGLSAVLLAMHWRQWRDSQAGQLEGSRWQLHLARALRRRTVASSLLGVIGVCLMAFETVPRTPKSITAYLLVLLLMTCWTLWLACLDMLANRRFHEEEQLDQIADELSRSNAKSGAGDSTKS